VADPTAQSDTRATVDRRFLLFQLDLTGPNVPASLRPRWDLSQDLTAQGVAISDYSDYDAPRSDIYWRDILYEETKNSDTGQEIQGDYLSRLASHFYQFASDLYQAVFSGQLGLRSASAFNDPYIDLSPYVRSVSGYQVDAGDLSNSMKLVVGRPDQQGDPNSLSANLLYDKVFNINDGILPRENDVIMVLGRYPDGPDAGQFFPEYLGMVEKVNLSAAYGQLDNYELTVSGISRISKSSDIVTQRSVSTAVFLPNVEIGSSEDVSVFADKFQDQNIQGIFQIVLSSVYSWITGSSGSGVLASSSGLPGYALGFNIDWAPFIPKIVANPSAVGPGDSQMPSINGGGFQHNFMTLLTLFLMSVTDASNREYFPARANSSANSSANSLYYGSVAAALQAAGSALTVPTDDSTVPLSPYNRAYLEHGNHQAYNSLIAQGYELFYPHLTKPADVLGDVRKNAFFDVFESRDGLLICRPGRYNKIERSLSEIQRANAETDINGNPAAGGFSPQTLFAFDPATSTYEFNPAADFYIASEEILDLPDRVFDNEPLDSRADIKLMFKYDGSQGQSLFAGFYVDPDVLLRFGLKSKGPITNPNALNADAPWVFAPLALAMNNAPSRAVSVTVRDRRKFRVGKLYYIEPLDCVAFLSSDVINHANSALSTRTLQFIMVRRVIRRPISAMLTPTPVLHRQHEILNLAMCYLGDPPGDESVSVEQFASESGLSDPAQYKNMRQVMLAKGNALANYMLSLNPPGAAGAVAGPTVANAKSQAQRGPQTPGAGSGARMVMFRYLPTILDVALEVEANPQISQNSADVPASNQAAATAANGRLNAALLNGDLAAMAGFTTEANQQPYDPVLQAITMSTTGISTGDDPKTVLIPAGTLGYGLSSSPSSPITGAPAWDSLANSPAAPLSWFQTPFSAQTLSATPQNVTFSQLLANKLAGVDLSMKFQLGAGSPLTPRFSSIPQLYFFDGAQFDLLTVGVAPQAYLKTIPPIPAGQFVGIPQCLAFNLSSFPSTMASSCYQVAGSGGIFRLPFGHFVLIPALSSEMTDAVWVRVQNKTNPILGGSVRIVPGSLPRQFVVTPADEFTTLTVEDGNNDGAGTPINGSTGWMPPPPNQPNLYFVTPFAEPTIERMLNFALPPNIGGQVTQQQLNAVKDQVKSQPGGGRVLTGNNRRVMGDAINLSPDYLALFSQSDLLASPTRPSLARLPLGGGSLADAGIFWLFEQALLGAISGNFAGIGRKPSTGNPGELVPLVGALTASLTYPNGGKPPAALQTRSCLVYQIQVIDETPSSANLTDDVKYALAVAPQAPPPPPPGSSGLGFIG
jgi:hypothetical protein